MKKFRIFGLVVIFVASLFLIVINVITLFQLFGAYQREAIELQLVLKYLFLIAIPLSILCASIFWASVKEVKTLKKRIKK